MRRPLCNIWNKGEKMRNKLAMIGHSYHLKTKSNDFFMNLLNKYFDIEYIIDESWKSTKKPKLGHLGETYSAVIFWQMISHDYLKAIKCKNIIFIPMFDQSGSAPRSYWYHYRDLKIISFCKTMGNMLAGLGFDVLNAKYYPEPAQVNNEERPNSCFFWQRINTIDWPKVKILLRKSGVKTVHIHKAIDPGHKFTKPSANDEKKYNITYSDWFPDRASYLKVVDENQIYIAPRFQEGIGLSFLEAMARGKIVVAADQPTMNEYIIDGYNGYLFDPYNVKAIDFSNINSIKKNSLLSIKNGHKEWIQSESAIIDFIEKQNKKNFYFRKHPFARFDNLTLKNILTTLIKSILPYGIVRLIWYLKENGRWKRIIKETIKVFIPYGIIKLIRYLRSKRTMKNNEEE